MSLSSVFVQIKETRYKGILLLLDRERLAFLSRYAKLTAAWAYIGHSSFHLTPQKR